ncbi:hypothetical protein J4573_13835 [Actinomadura barringtoniae]|uniref:Uncharacterized protein n=1 Tax=Actinomadura barringtoniae TaxID=1427535 RepID=A0A939T9P3_9ACTN|nr:hypothetical protein [Actinomadura barringtoniae]MBO2448180.1 hypothetical protein [Actinomadura barringtoniae]
MPKFVVAVMPKAKTTPSRLEVRDSRTGRLIGTHRVTGTHTEFQRVVSAGDGRTFYAVAGVTGKKSCRTDLYRFSLSADGRPQTLIPTGLTMHDRGVTDLAVSPDRTKIAYLYSDDGCGGAPLDTGSGDSGGGNGGSGGDSAGVATPRSLPKVGVGVFDIASRKRSQWTAGSDCSIAGVNWLPHGQGIGFLVGDALDHPDQLRRISPSSPSAVELIKNSALVYRAPEQTSLDAVFPAPDGRTYYFFATRYKAAADKSDPATPSGGDYRYMGPSAAGEPVSAQIVKMSAGSTTLEGVASTTVPDDLSIAILHGEASGRYLLSGDGIVDLQRGGRPRQVTGLRGAEDVAW